MEGVGNDDLPSLLMLGANMTQQRFPIRVLVDLQREFILHGFGKNAKEERSQGRPVAPQVGCVLLEVLDPVRAMIEELGFVFASRKSRKGLQALRKHRLFPLAVESHTQLPPKF